MLLLALYRRMANSVSVFLEKQGGCGVPLSCNYYNIKYNNNKIINKKGDHHNMKRKTFVLFSALTALATILLSVTPQPVSAILLPPAPPLAPAAGNWIVTDEEATEGLIPQFELEAELGDYALLQSDGVVVVGSARICHPYRGGQFGWTSEIRRATPLGWLPVPTTNGWEPDEEGQYMTCAEVGSGTYAVFGYWEKPAGWDLPQCPPEDYPTYVMDVTDFLWLDIGILEAPAFFNDIIFLTGKTCGPNGTIILSDDSQLDFTFLYYCCNDKLYQNNLIQALN